MLARLVGSRVNTSKDNQRASVSKTGDFTNLSHELGRKRLANAVHRHDNRVFWELLGKGRYLGAEQFHSIGNGVELRGYGLDEQLREVILWRSVGTKFFAPW